MVTLYINIPSKKIVKLFIMFVGIHINIYTFIKNKTVKIKVNDRRTVL